MAHLLDGGLGGITYILEILTGVIGLKARWRTMPWLVVLFGLMIVPLSITSISFVIIQPIVIGTWGTLTLIGAAAMLLQIPYAIDELLASLQFLRRRARGGKNWLLVFFVGDTDEGAPAATSSTEVGEAKAAPDEFDRSPVAIVRDMLGGGVSLPWNLALSGLIAASLLFTGPTFGSTGAMANADHVIGFLVLTTLLIAAAEPTRALRYVKHALRRGVARNAVCVRCRDGRDHQQYRVRHRSHPPQPPAWPHSAEVRELDAAARLSDKTPGDR